MIKRREIQTRLFYASLVLFAGVILVSAVTPEADELLPEVKVLPLGDTVQFNDFAGSSTCAPCHGEIYSQWQSSTHGKAGGLPGSHEIIGQFDGVERRFKDGSFIPFIDSDGHYKFRLKKDGFPEQVFQVDAIVGGGHMVGGGTQTYFSKFPDGTIRFLPFDFIRDERVWFGETDQGRGWIPITEDLPIGELSEWPPSRILGSHFNRENCQECHGSQIEVKYLAEAQQYQSKFKTLAINCESCHGPGKRHVELMNAPGREALTDIGMASLATLDEDGSLMVCFSCHALKDVLEPGYLPGKDLEAHYALKFPILGANPYHPDGRIKAFGYQQNHLNSDCYLNGKMTCVSCHEPHSQDYQDINGNKLADRFDDRQCTSCHPSKAVNQVAHTFHQPDSPGNKCVSCHMPYLQHQAMGNNLRFARSDHTIPIPRPAFDAAQGIENACSQCHQDKTVDWLQVKVEEWWGEVKPHPAPVAKLYEVKSGMSMSEAATLLLDTGHHHLMAQMAGLSQFTTDYLKPNMKEIDPSVVARIKAMTQSSDLDVKSLAMASLHMVKGDEPEMNSWLMDNLKKLSPEDAAKVKARWTTALPFLGEQYMANGELNDAIATYEKALSIDPDKINLLINFGRVYESGGDYENAVKVLSGALQLDLDDENAWLNLGNVLQKKGDHANALVAYRRAAAINPWNAAPQFNIGNYYYQANENATAAQYYQKAIALDPSLAVGYFFLARAQIKMRYYAQALQSVEAGLSLNPDDQAGLQMRRDLRAALKIE